MWLHDSKFGIYRGGNSANAVNDDNWKFITIVRNSHINSILTKI